LEVGASRDACEAAGGRWKKRDKDKVREGGEKREEKKERERGKKE
jgi:hypothetical protein